MPFMLPNNLTDSDTDKMRKRLLQRYIEGVIDLDVLQEMLEDVAIREHNELLNDQK